jgi:hypothetical protein
VSWCYCKNFKLDVVLGKSDVSWTFGQTFGHRENALELLTGKLSRVRYILSVTFGHTFGHFWTYFRSLLDILSVTFGHTFGCYNYISASKLISSQAIANNSLVVKGVPFLSVMNSAAAKTARVFHLGSAFPLSS